MQGRPANRFVSGRKRALPSSVTLQTRISDSHRNYFQTMECEDRSECKVATYEEFFNYDFIESLSLKNIDTPVRLDMTTWNMELLDTHLRVVQSLKSHTDNQEQLSSINATEEMCLNFIANENTLTQLICETDNLVLSKSSTEDLRKKDDEISKMKLKNLEEIVDVTNWFNDPKEVEEYTKMSKLVSFWLFKKNVTTYTECSEKIANRLNHKEEEDLVGMAKEHLMKDVNLFKSLQNKKHIFDLLGAEVGGDAGVGLTNQKPSESFFRKARALWDNVKPTPGFEGVEYDTFNKLKKVTIVSKGENYGCLLEDIAQSEQSSSNLREVDIFTVDENITAKLNSYLKNPSFSAWKEFVHKEYIPGSAVFFHPTLLHPVESSKNAFLAMIHRRPLHCFDKNNITQQGLNLSFYVLSFDSEHGEWWLGPQDKLESKNSTQRRRLILKKNQAVLATQLPGKKNIDSHYHNTVWYGSSLKNADVDDGKVFD